MVMVTELPDHCLSFEYRRTSEEEDSRPDAFHPCYAKKFCGGKP
jgi:hypothetical protein